MIIDENGNKVESIKEIPTEIISDEEQNLIRAYLQGAIYAWCNCKKQEEFQFATFSGGDNYYWEGTPLYPLYENQPTNDENKALADAAKYGGVLLKQVLINDKRLFLVKKILPLGKPWKVNVYSWTGKEDGK